MSIEILKGKTLVNVEAIDDELIFTTNEGVKYKLYHDQDCCEDVVIDDICGDLKNLIGEPLLIVEERSNENESQINKIESAKENEKYTDSFSWTFYEFVTIRGSVTVRWFGASNGYYSEGVSFKEIK